MKYLIHVIAALVIFAFQPAFAQPAPTVLSEKTATAPETVKVAMQTTLGTITVAIEKQRAPITAGNFLAYVDQKRFDGSNFYRAVKIGDNDDYGMVQGGLRGDPKRVFKPIPHEPTNKTGLSHVNGAISMARADPGTATADFFIVIGDLPALDAHPESDAAKETDRVGYAVFGNVIAGMEVVKKILQQPRSETAGEGAMKGQMLASPVKIINVRRVQ